MASKFSIEAIFKGNDQLSKVMRKVAGEGSTFSRRFGADMAKAERSMMKMGEKMKNLAGKALTGAVVGGMAAIAIGTGIATREFIAYDQAITAASAKFKGLNLNTEAGQKTLLELKKVARDVGAATQFTATQAAEGLDYLAMAGFNAEQAMKMLPGITSLATVAGVDLARATDIASDALGAFNLMTTDTLQLQKNLTRVNDVAAKTTTMFNTDLDALFESVKAGASTFTAAGQSMESFNALVGVMSNAGVKGSESGTSLRNVMLRLADPVKKARDVLDDLGIQTMDSQGNFRDIIDILADFEKGLEGMGTAQRTAALSTVFGARSVTGINILLAEGSSKLKQYRADLEKAGGSADEMASIMRGSLVNQIEILKSTAIEVGFKFVEAFEKDGARALQKITKAIQNIDVEPFIEGIKTIANILKVVFNIVKPLVPIILTLVSAWMSYKIAVYAVVVAQNIMNGLLVIGKFLQFIKIIFMIAKAKGVWAAAQWALNFAMNANPIGLIILGIAALIAIIVALAVVITKNLDVIKNGFKTVFDFVLAYLFTVADTILSTFGNIIKSVMKAVSFVGKSLGIDTSGLEKAIATIDGLQTKVRENSLFSEQGRAKAISGGRDTTKSTRNETVTTNELIVKNESNNRVEFGGKQIGRDFQRSMPSTSR